MIWLWMSELEIAENVFLNDLESLDSTCGSIARSERATECSEVLFFTFSELLIARRSRQLCCTCSQPYSKFWQNL